MLGTWDGYFLMPCITTNVIKLKWEIMWTGGLPHLSRLPHLPKVPHLHVNRPLIPRIRLQQLQSCYRKLRACTVTGTNKVKAYCSVSEAHIFHCLLFFNWKAAVVLTLRLASQFDPQPLTFAVIFHLFVPLLLRLQVYWTQWVHLPT